MIGWEQLDDGIVVLTMDDPEQSTNTINDRFVQALGSTVDRLERDRESVTGVVVTSAKDGFLAGADLKSLTAATADVDGETPGTGDAPDRDAHRMGAAAFRAVQTVNGLFRRLERLGRPVVAALNGTALGGGFELALACHHRIAVDSPDARFGLPEVTLGLMPGAGGTVRVPRMLGVQEALTSVLLQGQRLRPAAALRLGLVDELVVSPDLVRPAAIAWLRANPEAATQRWEQPGYRVPGGRPSDPALVSLLPAIPANLRKQLKGAHYPAAHAIMCAVVEGLQVDVDTASTVASRWFATLVGTPVQRNMTNAFFFELGHLNRGGSRPAGVPKSTVERVGVVGAGMMGAGIAYACAKAGIEVTLVDVSIEAAERGRDYSRRLLDRAVARGWSTSEDRDAHLARITPATELEALAGCDAVIEAVFEDIELKRATFGRLATIVGSGTLLASNTSSLPITAIAEALPDPAALLGLHFFSPVDKMPLVEIVRGRPTSDTTLARGYDLVRALGKTPIVVHDSRGFFTSRVFGTYVMEGMALLGEGVAPATIEQAALQAGYPVGPLAVTDEVSLSLGRAVREQARRSGADLPRHPADPVVDQMLDRYDRPGKAAGRGFYDYASDGGGKRLWPGLADAFPSSAPPSAAPSVSMRELQERLLFVEAIESVRCLEEGVLTSTADGNIGSLLGIGFPAWTGGTLQYVEQYAGGVAGFVGRARELAERYGGRFSPPDSLLARL